MSVVYGQLAAKQAAAKILAKTGKKQFDYDSDEDVEDGGFQKLWKVFFDEDNYRYLSVSLI